MKKLIGGLALAIFFFILSGIGSAQGPGYGPGMMHGGWGGSYCPYCGAYQGPRGGYGMGPGMMYGRGPGYGRYGHGVPSEGCQKFLDETAALRKELHNKRYEYFEAVRNPKTKPEDVAKQEKEIRDLQEKIYAKNPEGCWW